MLHRLALVPLAALVVSLASLPALAQQPNSLTAEEIADGWILLFDGETTFGWHAAEPWRVENGALKADGDGKSWLFTTTEWSDFVLRLQYRLSEGGNSGVGFRAALHQRPSNTGYEVQLNDSDGNNPTGSVYRRERAVHPEGGLGTKAGEWQDLEITALGHHLLIAINGTQVVDTFLTLSDRGHIALQYHHPNMSIEYRSIRLRPLGGRYIFNGHDLQGWTVLPGHQSEFSVTDEGALRIQNGGGQIETKGVWDDFVLQMDVKTGGQHLNSGVFFRGLPGQFWSGYESQIMNRWEGDDTSRPVDFGTGGLYFHHPARKVVSRDEEWFKKTVLAHGKHIAVWIDGFQTTDWTDPRDPAENPREGARTAAGTISLQGHDPGTDLFFRNMILADYPPAR